MARDRKEYQKWSISRRKYSPKPKTPDDFAEIYITYSLNSSIETALAKLPEIPITLILYNQMGKTV